MTLHAISPELQERIDAWYVYKHTPYAPYVSLVDWLGWTVEEYDYWLKTGEEPESD